ncbi:MAG: putative toxin-antitoxin system toxin component, PIN family [Treponema sp.]|jgi:putative PIN family toxin of toxin-antitoxin system|nr:putative toxin-antitoxin system toxin component, PIN family [Treponema sp.]
MPAKAVLDTNVLVSALWTPGGNPAKILAFVPLGKILPCYTFPIMKEYREVLNRPRLKFSGSQTVELLTLFEWYGLMVTAETSNIVMADESDRKFFDAAQTCGAFSSPATRNTIPRPTLC